jgi:beta-N-acetylhexosaminidase
MTGFVTLRRAAAGTLLASFTGDAVPDWLARRAAGGLGGVCLYGSNRGADVAAVAEAVAPALLALDEEGGDVTRLDAATGSPLPGNAALGAADDDELTAAVAGALGARLRSLGVTLDLAPCADVNSDPANPIIGVRAFGADPELVARHTAAFVTGLQAAGVAACAKHYPGHGAVAVDSHVDLPTLTAPAGVLCDRELVPFRAAITAGVAAIMPGHLLVAAYDRERPASLSPVVLGDLRRQLGFTGLIVTDALDMGAIGGPEGIPDAVVRALTAGADLCCLGPDDDDALIAACVDAVVAATETGRLSPARVHDAAERVAGLRSTLAARAPGPGPGVPGDPGDLAALGAEVARRALRVDGEPPGAVAGAVVVELLRPPTIAAGPVPPGVAAALCRHDPDTTLACVAEGDDRAVASALLAARGRPLVVVARDAARRPAQAAALGTLLAARPDAVLVDTGWPGGDALPAAATRITTFGASPACGEAAARLLLGRIPRG